MEYLNKIILEMTKNGKSFNEVLEMPFTFFLELLSEQNKPKQETSLISAFGGGVNSI